MDKEKTITIPLWEYKLLNKIKEDLIIDMKIEEQIRKNKLDKKLKEYKIIK